MSWWVPWPLTPCSSVLLLGKLHCSKPQCLQTNLVELVSLVFCHPNVPRCFYLNGIHTGWMTLHCSWSGRDMLQLWGQMADSIFTEAFHDTAITQHQPEFTSCSETAIPNHDTCRVRQHVQNATANLLTGWANVHVSSLWSSHSTVSQIHFHCQYEILALKATYGSNCISDYISIHGEPWKLRFSGTMQLVKPRMKCVKAGRNSSRLRGFNYATSFHSRLH